MGQADHTNVVFSKVFLKDVQRLLQMDDLWKSRKKPTPLDYKDFQNVEMMKAPEQNLDWDQKPWSLMENVRVFRESLAEISADFNERRKTDPGFSMSFDKDDEASLNFVTAAANLRAHIFGISVQSRFSVKGISVTSGATMRNSNKIGIEMAGNIIPAIATTNAIVAGMIVMLAFKVLSDQLGQCKYTYLSWGGGRTHLLMNTSLEKPSPFCSVCSNTYLVLKMNTQTKTLGFLLDKVIMASGKGLGLEGEITIEEGGRYIRFFPSIGPTHQLQTTL